MKKIIKLFISQPMHGLDDKLIIKQREAIRNLVEKYINNVKGLVCHASVELIDQFGIPDPEDFNKTHITEKSQRLFRLGRSIQLLGEADVIVFYGPWRDAKGCVVEEVVCSSYNISRIRQNNLINFCKDHMDDPEVCDTFELLWPHEFDSIHEVINPFDSNKSVEDDEIDRDT